MFYRVLGGQIMHHSFTAHSRLQKKQTNKKRMKVIFKQDGQIGHLGVERLNSEVKHAFHNLEHRKDFSRRSIKEKKPKTK